jgi:hypothetical protein
VRWLQLLCHSDLGLSSSYHVIDIYVSKSILNAYTDSLKYRKRYKLLHLYVACWNSKMDKGELESFSSSGHKQADHVIQLHADYSLFMH